MWDFALCLINMYNFEWAADLYQSIQTRGRKLRYLLLIILESLNVFLKITASTPLPLSSSFRTNYVPYYLLQLVLVIVSFSCPKFQLLLLSFLSRSYSSGCFQLQINPNTYKISIFVFSL